MSHPSAPYQGLHEYYKDRGFKPTFAAFKSDQQLDSYTAGRVALFRDLLHLPPAMFSGARLCEFGPDTGENALVFARWGARLTLVEPNPAAWPEIRAYFDRYGLSEHLEAIVGETVEGFTSTTKFDFINAEGFIYTVQPTSLWVEKLADLLAPGGFAVANYLDRAGCLFELLWSLFHARYGQLKGGQDVDSAWELFEPKWNSIPHTRPFESWVKDVLENPFVRLKYLVDPAQLSSIALKAGLALHESWPRYQDPHHPFWHKRIPSEAVLEERRQGFIARSRLSFAFGKPLFVVADAECTATLNAAVLDLVAVIDGLIDAWDSTNAAKARQHVATLRAAVSGDSVMADSKARTATLAVLDSLDRVFTVLDGDSAEAVRILAREDQPLIDTWGSTTHYAVFRRLDKE